MFCGIQLQEDAIKWYFYPSSEIKGLMLKNSSVCQIDFTKGEIHFVANETFSDHYLGNSHAQILRQLLGDPVNKAMETGLSIYFSDSWQGHGHRYWANKLNAANQLPSLADLLNDENWNYASELIYGCAAASFCEFLIDNMGAEKFIAIYQSSEFDFLEFEADWKLFLEKQTIATSTKTENSLPYLKGFNFAHEGYRIYNGYGSKKSEQALVYLKEMQANAVAVVPYSFVRYPKKPSPIPVVKKAGTENDESVIQSSEMAQKLGFNVIMKPQIWVGRGMWTGDIEMSTNEEWKLFFEYYGHWISHYAMLSELYGWEMLCIGNELVQTTLKMEAEWESLIHSVRAIYNGPITYAANWGDEFENVGFWKHLDYIGLNCYYPLSNKDNPSNKDLEKGFDDVLRKVDRVHSKYNKPILFTEIGYPCIHSPWKEPHQDWGDFTPNPDHQKRCYEVVFKGLKKEIGAAVFCGGSSFNLEHSPRRNTGFSPFNKPAEEIVAKWFRSIE